MFVVKPEDLKFQHKPREKGIVPTNCRVAASLKKTTITEIAGGGNAYFENGGEILRPGDRVLVCRKRYSVALTLLTDKPLKRETISIPVVETSCNFAPKIVAKCPVESCEYCVDPHLLKVDCRGKIVFPEK